MFIGSGRIIRRLDSQSNAPVIWNPRLPPFGLERGIHFLCKWKRVKSPVPGDTTVTGGLPRPYCSTYTWYSLCKTTYQCNTWVKRHCWQPWSKNIHRIFERPANKLQRLLNAEWMSKYLYWRRNFIDHDFWTDWHWNTTLRQLKYRSVNRTSNSRIEFVSTDSVNSFWWLHTMWSHYKRTDSFDQRAQNPNTIHVR